MFTRERYNSQVPLSGSRRNFEHTVYKNPNVYLISTWSVTERFWIKSVWFTLCLCIRRICSQWINDVFSGHTVTLYILGRRKTSLKFNFYYKLVGLQNFILGRTHLLHIFLMFWKVEEVNFCTVYLWGATGKFTDFIRQVDSVFFFN